MYEEVLCGVLRNAKVWYEKFGNELPSEGQGVWSRNILPVRPGQIYHRIAERTKSYITGGKRETWTVQQIKSRVAFHMKSYLQSEAASMLSIIETSHLVLESACFPPIVQQHLFAYVCKMRKQKGRRNEADDLAELVAHQY